MFSVTNKISSCISLVGQNSDGYCREDDYRISQSDRNKNHYHINKNSLNSYIAKKKPRLISEASMLPQSSCNQNHKVDEWDNNIIIDDNDFNSKKERRKKKVYNKNKKSKADDGYKKVYKPVNDTNKKYNNKQAVSNQKKVNEAKNVSGKPFEPSIIINKKLILYKNDLRWGGKPYLKLKFEQNNICENRDSINLNKLGKLLNKDLNKSLEDTRIYLINQALSAKIFNEEKV